MMALANLVLDRVTALRSIDATGWMNRADLGCAKYLNQTMTKIIGLITVGSPLPIQLS